MAVQETHGQPGRESALQLPDGVRGFWSAGTTQQAGVGLLVRESLLARFAPVRDSDWITPVAGRAAMLRLRGPEGALDIGVVYMHTGDAAAEREAVRQAIGHCLRPATDVLTFLVGDWNYVTSARDRFHRGNLHWSGELDTAEERLFSSQGWRNLVVSLNWNKGISLMTPHLGGQGWIEFIPHRIVGSA